MISAVFTAAGFLAFVIILLEGAKDYMTAVGSVRVCRGAVCVGTKFQADERWTGG
jgi:hypothetical protein